MFMRKDKRTPTRSLSLEERMKILEIHTVLWQPICTLTSLFFARVHMSPK
jgi:hypothetical protein